MTTRPEWLTPLELPFVVIEWPPGFDRKQFEERATANAVKRVWDAVFSFHMDDDEAAMMLAEAVDWSIGVLKPEPIA